MLMTFSSNDLLVSCLCVWLSSWNSSVDLLVQPRITHAMPQQTPPQGGSRKISFNVSDQYEIQDVIGEGAYGVVW